MRRSKKNPRQLGLFDTRPEIEPSFEEIRDGQPINVGDLLRRFKANLLELEKADSMPGMLILTSQKFPDYYRAWSIERCQKFGQWSAYWQQTARKILTECQITEYHVLEHLDEGFLRLYITQDDSGYNRYSRPHYIRIGDRLVLSCRPRADRMAAGLPPDPPPIIPRWWNTYRQQHPDVS